MLLGTLIARIFKYQSSLMRLDRNHVPWIVIIICYVVAAVLMIFIRFLLARENKRRDEEPYDDTYDNVYLEVIDEDGKAVQRRVSKVRKPPGILSNSTELVSFLGVSGSHR